MFSQKIYNIKKGFKTRNYTLFIIAVPSTFCCYTRRYEVEFFGHIFLKSLYYKSITRMIFEFCTIEGRKNAMSFHIHAIWRSYHDLNSWHPSSCLVLYFWRWQWERGLIKIDQKLQLHWEHELNGFSRAVLSLPSRNHGNDSEL